MFGKDLRHFLLLELEQRIKKGSASYNEYPLQIKKYVDRLASIGFSISVADHIEAIFEGLPSEYDNFIPSVTSRIEPYFVLEIEALLVAQENRIERYKKKLDIVIANLAQTQVAIRNNSRRNNNGASSSWGNLRGTRRGTRGQGYGKNQRS